MPTIKFSHEDYRKLLYLRHPKRAMLIEVLDVNIQDLSKQFLWYDTSLIGTGKYKLPSRGQFLLLIFHVEGTGVFTTLRSAYPKGKIAYYKKSIGEIFEIEIDKR